MNIYTVRKLHWVLAILWLVFFPVVILMGWEDSVPLLVFISIYANFVGHISSAQAAEAEINSPDA